MAKYRLHREAIALTVAALWMTGCSHSSGEEPPAATAATSTSMQREGYTPPEDVREVTVTVQDVDSDDHTVTFKAHVTPEANIQRNGMQIRLDQLKKGDALRMYVDTRTGEVVRADVSAQQK